MSYAKTLVKWHKFEIEFCRLSNRACRIELLRKFFHSLSRIGDGGVWVALIVCFALIVPNGLNRAGHLSLLALFSLIVYYALKRLSRRPRPLHRDSRLIISTQPLDRYSFPSGHTLHAVSLSYTACHYEPRLVVFLAPLAGLIAASRVVLGLHYPSDVIAASIFGLTFAESSIGIASSLGCI